VTPPESTNSFSPANTIRSHRVFTFTLDRIWSAFSDPKALAAWWGPAGVTNTFEEFDFRPGGIWRFTMHGPDGTEYPMNHMFAKITDRALIVFDHIDPVHGFRMHVYFAPVAENVVGSVTEPYPEKTEIRWAMVFDFAEEASKVRSFVEAANEQNFDRLTDFLKPESNATQSA
jgi:uncharacterized protein YndB with AHSA1/START domain